MLTTFIICLTGCQQNNFSANSKATTVFGEPILSAEKNISAKSTSPADDLPTKEDGASTTASAATSLSSTPPISITTKAATTVFWGSADCFEVDESKGPYRLIRDSEREFPLNLAGITVLNYYFTFPEDFSPNYGWYTFLCTGYTFLDSCYSELFTSVTSPDLFDDEFSYIGNRDYVGRTFDPSSIQKISVGDKIGNLTVEDAAFEISANFGHGTNTTGPRSGYVKLSGSVTLKGVAVKENDIVFYVYPDSVRKTEFPFLNLGNSSTIVSNDEFGLYSEYTNLCFLLDENDIDFEGNSFCEAEITFTNIEQSWDDDRNDDYFGICLCTAEKAEVKIL